VSDPTDGETPAARTSEKQPSSGQRPILAKQIEAWANKCKQKGFGLLAFIFPNPELSMGYGKFKLKNSPYRSPCRRARRDAPFLL
jgi:hypothetical protein